MKLRRLPLLLGELDRAPPDFDLNYLSIDRYANLFFGPDGKYRESGGFV